MRAIFLCYGVDTYNGFISVIAIEDNILNKFNSLLSNIDYKASELQGPFQVSLGKHVSIVKALLKLKLSIPNIYTKWKPIYHNELCLYSKEVILHKYIKKEYRHLERIYEGRTFRLIASCNQGGINGVLLKKGNILNLPLNLTLNRYFGMRLAYSLGIVFQTYRFKRGEK